MLLRAWLTGFAETLVADGDEHSRQASFDLKLAYDRGATVADALKFWRVWRQAGQESAPSRFKWWLRTRARQRESLKRSLARRKPNGSGMVRRTVSGAQSAAFGRK
jgi:hypothetical protein